MFPRFIEHFDPSSRAFSLGRLLPHLFKIDHLRWNLWITSVTPSKPPLASRTGRSCQNLSKIQHVRSMQRQLSTEKDIHQCLIATDALLGNFLLWNCGHETNKKICTYTKRGNWLLFSPFLFPSENKYLNRKCTLYYFFKAYTSSRSQLIQLRPSERRQIRGLGREEWWHNHFRFTSKSKATFLMSKLFLQMPSV